MKLFLFLLVTVYATDLRRVSEHSDCEICLNLYERLRNSSFSSIEVLKTKARQACHTMYEDGEESICLSITDDAINIGRHLFAETPNGCEINGYCSNCVSCGPDCIHCKNTCYVTRLFKRFWNM